MDEYFCPNCQAVLNDQWGFDPEGNTWTCTECGQLLMDEDIYDGGNFKGVAWYCDKCGELLNKQYGFSDSYGSWTCTECGHTNGITDDDIIEGTRFSCPNCYATLNNQFCFNQYLDDWECTECGAKLHRDYSDEEYTVVDDRLKCPNCGDILSNQTFYSDYEDDWTCEECGAQLHRDYSDEEYTVVEDRYKCPKCGDILLKQTYYADYKDDWTCTACGAKLHRDYSCDPYDIIENGNDKNGSRNNVDYSQKPYIFTRTYSPHRTASYVNQISHVVHNKRISEGEARKKRIKAFLLKRKKIEIGYDYTELLRRNYLEIQTILYNQAFNKIIVIPIKDIYVHSPYAVGETEQIKIGGNSYFHASDKIPYDTEIIITYHEKKEISIPFSARSLRKKNYIDVGDQLQSLGFTEIYERPIEDLTTGWITKDGSVESVSIDGNTAFKKNYIYKYDVKIIIDYHTFKLK